MRDADQGVKHGVIHDDYFYVIYVGKNFMSEHTIDRIKTWPLLGGILAAIAASMCCIGPLVLVMLGMGGAWVSSLTALEPFRPLSLGMAVAFLLFSWKKIYRTPASAGAPNTLCAMPHTDRIYKAMFWILSALVAIALGSPYLAPLFY